MEGKGGRDGEKGLKREEMEGNGGRGGGKGRETWR